jgi:hypothetical protein
MVLKATVFILFIGPIEHVLILLNLKTVFGITTTASYSQNIWPYKGRPISQTELHYHFTLCFISMGKSVHIIEEKFSSQHFA